MRLSVGYVDKVFKFNEDTNSSLASPRNTPVQKKIPAAVVEYLETEKLSKPTVYTSELQQRFLLDGFSPPGHFPSQLAIKKCIREDCKMTRKKISQVLKESLSQVNTDYTNYFLNQIGQSDQAKLHFCDECSAIVTSGYRMNGNTYIGEPAIEIQRYASKANRTLNLLHSATGVDYFDVLKCPSIGMELFNFFNEALLMNRADGSTILEDDVVICQS